MSKKGIITILVLLIIIVLVVLAFGDREDAGDTINQELIDEGIVNEVKEETLEGIISDINTEQAMVDGPYLITLENGQLITLPSMGIMLCEARPQLADIGDLKIGQTVQVKGSLGPDGQIVPCESSEHYLRIVE